MDGRTELRQGWLWPKDDRRCWRATTRHWDLPQQVMRMTDRRGVVVQAGGNCGVYASQYAEAFKTVYTFEPEHTNFHCLTHNLQRQKNIHKFQAFLGKGTEKTSGITNPADQQSEANSGMFERTTATGDIAVLSIDYLGLTGCDLIHLDIEGGEHDALHGAEQTIRQFRPLICLEWFQNRDELSRLMDSLNYKDVGMAGGSDKMFVYKD
jgi:FkbM family methyltransferase